MDSAIIRLLKVLDLERKQGYRNKAVIGGLDKFASRWETDARAETDNSAVISEIVSLMLGYAVVEERPARERILDLITRRAQSLIGAPDALEESAPGVRAPEDAPPAPAPDAPGAPERPRERAPETLAPRASKPFTPAPAPPPSGPAAQQPTPTPGHAPPEQRPNFQRAAEPVAETHPLPEPKPTPEANWPGRPAAPPAPRVEAPQRAEPPPPTRAEPRQPRPNAPGLDAPVIRLPNIGPAFAEKLAKLGVETVRDLLYLLPHRYDDFSQLRTIDKLKFGEEVTVIGTVWDVRAREVGNDRKMVTARVGDGTGELQLTWFNPWIEKQLRVGQAYSFAGKVDTYRSALVMRNAEFEPLDRALLSTGRLAPVYPLTEGVSVRWLRGIIRPVLDAWGQDLPDFMPEDVRRSFNLITLAEAITQIHFPDNHERLAAAHRRLSFDEFLLLQLGVLAARERFRGAPAKPLRVDDGVISAFATNLPFAMTGAQERALREVAADLQSDGPMGRLLQGDVGSGKTAVAAAALWVAVANGSQGAIMAPTEILAEQHARSFGRMFADMVNPASGQPVRVALLTGAMAASEREEALAGLAAGNVDIAIGTHALIQKGVEFRDLALAVVDEQHRFGVEQRAALRQKGAQPHMLVMSATPIPRSLALTLYGDLDVSVIDEMPAGRTPIRTKWLTSSQRERAYAFIRRQVAEGRQAFIVYPLVEESEVSEARAAVEEHARLSANIFPDLKLGLLHGRLKSEEKDAAMRAFGAGELDVLVATSVVEVGIDVPNATVIMIEGAERFGLAQLHQFRGRVGRGEYPSYCILVSDVAEGEGVRRLEALENNTDGFALAQIDLELRGPGDFFGTRQSGLPPLQTAELSDLGTLEDAREAAKALFRKDPELQAPEHRELAAQVAAFWRGGGDIS
jgi:ATP-dependent DNA helicase RecG